MGSIFHCDPQDAPDLGGFQDNLISIRKVHVWAVAEARWSNHFLLTSKNSFSCSGGKDKENGTLFKESAWESSSANHLFPDPRGQNFPGRDQEGPSDLRRFGVSGTGKGPTSEVV